MQAEKTIPVPSTGQLPAVAAEILQFAGNDRLFFLEGEMGAGKTTLIKALCSALGSQGPFSSPTFPIIQTYQADNKTIYHCDLYRIQRVEELMDLGFEEILESGDYVFVEWPQLLLNNFETTGILLKLNFSDQGRMIHLRKMST